MAKVGGCLFRIGYFLYTRTRIGYYYHRRDVAKAKEKYGLSSGHTVVQPAEYGCRYTPGFGVVQNIVISVLPNPISALQIIPIPMALDNYAYLIVDTQSKVAVVVDPGDPEPVENVLNEVDITPEAVLITHKHWDHSGGNSQMKNHYRGIRIYGGIHDDVPDVTHSVTDHDVLEFGRLKFHVVFTPGHTEGHVVYVLDGSPFGAPDSMFSGDQLFLSGCGRMFEMPASVMLRSLDTISQMKPSMLIWPGHEYAKENLEFACHLEPNNKAAQRKWAWVKQQRQQKLRTCPSTIQEELTYNPFLRTKEESVLFSIGVLTGDKFTVPSDEVRARVLTEIRERKDNFKYLL